MAEVKRRRKAAVAGIAPSEPERDILDQYLYEVSTFPLLKGTEEIDVARRIRAGDRCKLILGDRRFPQIEVVHESDFALLFQNPMTVLGIRAPHDERTGRHPDHHNADGTLEF